MPQFNCKMLTPQGQIIKSRVEEASRLACIRKLRRNGLTPISVTPVISITSGKKGADKQTKKARNIKPTANFETRREAKNKAKNKNKKAQGGLWELLNSDLGGGGRKPSSRDIRVFSQNFYLLKKANFNNIHALSTVIQTTENPRLRTILEDILAGVEGRRVYVYDYGILFKCIPIYLY
ncbi:MAG: hypothetical protein IJ867_02865 [Clostridia bacterium]|nr:hypothetical protein [Clostridia bacterium]